MKLLLLFVLALSILGTSNAMKRLMEFDSSDEDEPVFKCPRPQDHGGNDTDDDQDPDYTADSQFLFWAVQHDQVDIVQKILHHEEALERLTVLELVLALNDTKNIAITRMLEWAIEKKLPNWAAEKDMVASFLRLHV